MTKNFRTLREKMSPESRERSSALAAKYGTEMPVNELRETLDIAQVHLARPQSQPGRGVENGAPHGYVRKHVQNFIRAMGGELKIAAKFPPRNR